ncbi:MAG: Na+/H+ antiporter NhaA [Actinobacteria bacterium]|nr:Na+/H+ antiporter NhaA [Actinomycetota bacterium]
MAKRQPLRPLRDFLATESAGGILAVGGAVAALIWVNVAPHSYNSLWSHELSISLGHHALQLSLKHWVNDGLMALFFLVVGLEIKRELVLGELRVLRRAALPIVAAIGGMVIPAALFAVINSGTDTSHGWGVPMATDIALALGVIALLGRHIVPPSLSLFLLAVAIVDDIGAIVVIAVFYSNGIQVTWLAAAAAMVALTVLLRRLRVTAMWPFIAIGLAMWFSLHEAGVHATIAGVIMGLLAPTAAPPGPNTVSVVERLEHGLHPFTSFLIVPLFAISNAGIRFDNALLDGVLSSHAFWGVVIGLVIGKPVGITLASWLAVRAGVAEYPTGVRLAQVGAVGAVAGIGFTVSLFVSELAFTHADQLGQAKFGVLIASIVAGLIGVVALRAVAYSERS